MYDFAKYLFNVVYNNWTGFLDPNLVYITSKILVLMGLPLEARKISQGYDFHPGCCSARLSSYYRNSNSTDEREISNLLKLANMYLQERGNTENIIVVSDLVTWIAAFLPVKEVFNFYLQNKERFNNAMSCIMVIDRLFSIPELSSIATIITHINKMVFLSNYEQILFNNKKAVFYQIKGNQKQALDFLELAEKGAVLIGDISSASKILFNKGSSYFLIDEYDLSFKSYQKAETFYQLLGDEVGSGKCFNALSTVYNAIGEYSIAEKYVELAEHIFSDETKSVMKQGILYKHAYILYLKGEYEDALNIIYQFDLKDRTILNFEINLLKLSSHFEMTRHISFDEINTMIGIADELNYSLGKANLLLEFCKMLTLQGKIIEAKTYLDASYKIFHKINNYRGVIRCLLMNALVDMLEDNINEAESFCVTALDKAKRLNLYLEEKEAKIVLGSIFFFKNQNEKAKNLFDSILFSLESKNIHNNYFLQAMLNKCYFAIDNQEYDVKRELIDFIKFAKNSGSQYWMQHSQILEAQELLYRKKFNQSNKLVSDVRLKTQNFDIKFLATKILLQGLLQEVTLLKKNKVNEIKIIEKVKKILNILEGTEIEIQFDLQIHQIELGFLKLQLYQILYEQERFHKELNLIKEIIQKYNLTVYNKEVINYEQNPIADKKTTLEVNYLLIA